MYRIWVRMYAENDLVGESMSAKMYVRKGNAERVAKRLYQDTDSIRYEWLVAEENPWGVSTSETPEEKRNHEFADELREWLLDREMWIDTVIYFNGKAYAPWDRDLNEFYYNDRSHLVEYAADPADYMQFVNRDTVTVSFEGPLYELINYDFCSSEMAEFDEIFKRHGMYYELGDAWNLACYEL